MVKKPIGNQAFIFRTGHFGPKIVVSCTLAPALLAWYHEFLYHPGVNRTEQALRQHYYWPELSRSVIDVRRKKYGHLPAISMPLFALWEHVAIDLIGPYRIETSNHTLTL